MNKNTLIEILNSNKELLQELKQSKFLEENFVGMLRNIESIIPIDYRDNFYSNLKTLRLNLNDEELIKEHIAGEYSYKKNQLSIDKTMLDVIGQTTIEGEIDFEEALLMTLYHELLHMASTTRDDFGSISGFQNIEKDENGEFLYADILKGMTEGFTEYLTLLAFDKEIFETSSIYGKQINSMSCLSMIVGLEKMKRAYFNNRNGMHDIEKVLKEIDEKSTHIELYNDIEHDYKFSKGHEYYEPALLYNIDRQLLELADRKLEKLIKEYPNLSKDFISEYWQKVSTVINSKENLQLIDEEVSEYQNIDKISNLLKELSGRYLMEESQKKVDIGKYKDIENILNNDKLIKIYGLLPNRESKKEFLTTLLDTYKDRLEEKISERIEDEFEANNTEIKQGQLKENIQNMRIIKDVSRSRRREPLRQAATERINHLIDELQKGNYISKEDRDFLAKHLAERSNVEGTSPSSRREEIRNVIDTYIRTKNLELRNNATKFENKQILERKILHLKAVLANQLEGVHVNSTPEDIAKTKKKIQDLEELQESEQNRFPKDNSMINSVDSEFDIQKNNLELEDLMNILDKENEKLLQNGIKLPEKGLREDDEIEVYEDSEDEMSNNLENNETQQRPVFVVNARGIIRRKI